MKFAIRAAAAVAAAAVLALTVQGSNAPATAGGWCAKGPSINGTCPVGDPPPPGM